MKPFMYFHLLAMCAALFAASAQAQRLHAGPNTCKNGYVFREAWTNDQVCVSVKERQQVVTDNGHAAANIAPGPIGPKQCRQGLVWRAARPQDLVCVTPEQRQQAADDNYYDYGRKEVRLMEPRPKPLAPPRASAEALLESPHFEPGAGGVENCKARLMCPPRMAMAVEDGTCVCNGNR